MVVQAAADRVHVQLLHHRQFCNKTCQSWTKVLQRRLIRARDSSVRVHVAHARLRRY